MNKDTLFQYFDRHYIPRRDMLPRIPLGTNPNEFWKEIESRRRARSTTLPIHGPTGSPYWFVTTDRMVSASETIVEELMANDESVFRGPPVLAPLEEVFYTSYVEGSPMTMQAAMEFLQSGEEPRDIEEQMIVNNRSALNFAASNLYHPVDEEFIRMLTLILTQNMEGGGQDYRTADWTEIPSMMGEPYELPTALSVPNRMKELTSYLADPLIHPLMKAAVAHAWVLAARPFPEGNERLARLLSTVILVRFGYTFLGEISLSELVAKNGYPYYNAIANILRKENGGDLTYFLEYYLLLLAQAVDERRQRKMNAEADNLNMGLEMARTPLLGSTVPNLNSPGQTPADQPPPPKSSRQKVKESRDAVAESLAAEGFVSLLDENVVEGESQPPEGGDIRWSGERNARDGLNTIIISQGRTMPIFAKALVRCLDSGQYTFTVKDIQPMLDLDATKINKVIFHFRERGIIETIGKSGIYAVYTFCCGDLSESDYSAEMIRSLNKLASGSQSVKDKRIGTMLLSHLNRGYITARDYEESGDAGRWSEDMKLAEQMGFVKRISKDRCLILEDAQPCFEMLDTGQKKRARLMYETFGEETFSLEMVIATLDYSSSTASAYLHQFTLLRILDCRKEDVNLYQFLVNPREHPEIFEDAA